MSRHLHSYTGYTWLAVAASRNQHCYAGDGQVYGVNKGMLF
jgi:hypothetical protein